jgi:hypothetical protein
LLEVSDPAVLEALRRRHPDHADMLQRGMVMGATAATAATAVDHLYCDLSREGLSAAETQLTALLRLLPRRLSRAKTLRLIAAIVASLASAGVLSAVFSDAPFAARVASAVAFVAAVGNLLAQYVETPLAGGKGTLADSLDELVGIEAQLRELKARLVEADHHAPGEERCREIAQTVNDLAARIRRRQLFAGVG